MVEDKITFIISSTGFIRVYFVTKINVIIFVALLVHSPSQMIVIVFVAFILVQSPSQNLFYMSNNRIPNTKPCIKNLINSLLKYTA